jgi:diguanylate cyclase (GGDEF)-like protein/PAS domain S-box-containing protein
LGSFARWFVGCLAGALWCAAAWAQPREVRVGLYDNEPKIFADAQGRPAGILVELLQEVARLEGWTLRFQTCNWTECLDALEAGRIDLMPDVAYTGSRDEYLDFHDTPALLSWSQVYRRSDVPIATVLDLDGRRVAVLAGSVQRGVFTDLTRSFGIKPELHTVETMEEGFHLVETRQADAVIANQFFGHVQAPRHRLVETAIMFHPSRLFYATAQGRNGDLLAAIERHLAAWQNDPDSVYFAVLRRWAQIATPRVPPAVWWGLGGLLALLLLAVSLALLLRRQVAQRTQGLLLANEEVSRFKAIFDHATFAAWIANPDGTLNYVNARCAELQGVPRETLLGQRFMRFYAPSRLDEAEAFWRGVRDGLGNEVRELWHVATDGHEFPMLTSGTLLRDTVGHPAQIACTAVDISDRKRAEAQIRHLAFYDALTGLPNRRLLTDHLQHALATGARRGGSGALLFIDLDQFKTINDTLGHDVGDQLLKEVATRIQLQVRVGDTVARLGGDEFIVLLEELSERPGIAASQAEGVGRKILAALNRPYRLAGNELHSTPSMGVTLFVHGQGTVDELLKQADLAMYQAKAAGRNTLRFFDPQMQAVVAERAALESDLRNALQGQGQLALYIQPQIDRQGHVIGAEGLLRWQHPRRGTVLPAAFIPVAEDSGLIHPLGQWVLEAACRELVRWAGLPALQGLNLAVNVSTQQFRHPDFVPQVLAVLARTGAAAPRLKLEITESLLMHNVEDVIAKMEALRAHGVRFSLDDFGTGYSSLAYLKRLPLDQLKIDQSFVRDLLTDPNDASIVSTIIALGHSLNLMVVAEGVETSAQRYVLDAGQCHAYQGYLFSRPLPADEFVRYVEQHSAEQPALG